MVNIIVKMSQYHHKQKRDFGKHESLCLPEFVSLGRPGLQCRDPLVDGGKRINAAEYPKRAFVSTKRH